MAVEFKKRQWKLHTCLLNSLGCVFFACSGGFWMDNNKWATAVGALGFTGFVIGKHVLKVMSSGKWY